MITWFRDEAHRAYVYRVSTALIPALSGYGLVSDRVVPVIAAVVAAVFNVGLAAVNTSTK